MRDPLKYPKLRWPIDISTQEVQGKQVLLIRCPLGITTEPLVLTAVVAPVVSEFSGQNSVEDILEKYSQYGLQPEVLTELVTLLEQNLFLESPAFESAKNESVQEFIDSPVRNPALAGIGYYNDASSLSQFVDDLVVQSNGTPKSKKTMISLIAPHIDYQRGSKSYGETYGQLADHEHDLYLLMGTSHQYSKRLFHLTGKHFETPLGVLKTDEGFTNKLIQLHGPERSLEDEILHKQEHSLELQTPFLKRLADHAQIVPVLVGSFYPMLKDEKYPEELEEYDSFASSMVKCLQDEMKAERKICFVAGVDMAHVGQAFGDEGSLSTDTMREIEDRDRIYLEAIKNQNKKALFDHIAEDGDARRVCGFPTIYTVLDILDRLEMSYEVDVFGYHQAVNYDQECAVTFAGLGLYAI